MEEAYLGVDIGSISTKGVIIDKDYKILASEYIWTEGDPMGAARKLIELLEKQFDKEKYRKDQIYGGEDDVIHNGLYLLRCSRPRAFDRTGYIPAGVGGDGQQRDEHCRHDEY